MKKKTIYIVCGIFIAVALIGMLIFVLTGKDDELSAESIDMTGTWKVAEQVDVDVPTFIEGEFIVFDETQVARYKAGSSEPYATSAYEVSAKKELSAPDISSVTYTVDDKTDNVMRLYENAKSYMVLIRHPNEDMTEVTVDQSILPGKWDVINKGGPRNEPVNEVLEFTEDMLHDYRDDAAEPASSSTYSWVDESNVFADSWGLQVEVHPLSEDRLIFIEAVSGVVWDLQRVEE